MQTPSNPFKQALLARRAQIGLWLGLASPYSAEICAGAGFDWLLVDGEHSPNTVDGLLRQLQVIAAYPQSHPIVRVPVGLGHAGTTVIKQVLDIGAQTLLVPMIDTADQAAEVVRATRYAPQGIRGMAGARASRWGRYPNYPQEANAHICVLVQAESGEALENLEAICAVDGVDGVFIGPADLSASLGYVGQSTHPDMLALMEKAIARIQAAGKAAGILTPDEAQAKRYLELGATFVAVGLDTQILVRQTSALAARFKSDVSTVRAGQAY